MDEFQIKTLLRFLKSYNIVKIVNSSNSDKLYVYFKHKELLLVVSFSAYLLLINSEDSYFDVVETSILDHITYIDNLFFKVSHDNTNSHLVDIMCDLICFHFLCMADIQDYPKPDEQELYWDVLSKIRSLYKEGKTNLEVYQNTLKHLEFDNSFFEKYLRNI